MWDIWKMDEQRLNIANNNLNLLNNVANNNLVLNLMAKKFNFAFFVIVFAFSGIYILRNFVDNIPNATNNNLNNVLNALLALPLGVISFGWLLTLNLIYRIINFLRSKPYLVVIIVTET